MFWFFLLLHFWDSKSSCSWDEMGLKVPIVARGFTGNALSDVENMLAGSASLLANCLKRNIWKFLIIKSKFRKIFILFPNNVSEYVAIFCYLDMCVFGIGTSKRINVGKMVKIYQELWRFLSCFLGSYPDAHMFIRACAVGKGFVGYKLFWSTILQWGFYFFVLLVLVWEMLCYRHVIERQMGRKNAENIRFTTVKFQKPVCIRTWLLPKCVNY